MLKQVVSRFFRATSLLRLFVVGIATLPGVATAAIMYGDFSDVPPGAVQFTSVEVGTIGPDDEPLFGAPTVAADVLEFEGSERFTIAAAGGLSDSVEGVIEFGLAGVGVAITSIETGAYGLASTSGDGIDQTAIVLLSAIDQVTVLEVDGAPIAAPVVLPGKQESQMIGLQSGPITDLPWETSLSYDLNAALADSGVSYRYGASKLQVVLGNAVGLSSDDLSSVQASLRSFTFIPRTVPVPEPTGAGLAALGAFALAVASFARS